MTRPGSISANRRGIVGRLVALLAAAVLVAASGAPASAATKVSGSAVELLASLTTAPEHPEGYIRTLFVHWIDADQDGCSTRSEVLIAESRPTARVGPDCSVAGSWRSAYDGLITTGPSRFDIDHVVALKEAWDSGAWDWTPARRKSFANDLGDWRSLRAVTAASNRSKSDKDPGQWLPPLLSFHCTYATEWVVVKVRWTLQVDARERAALQRILVGCPTRTVTVAVLPTSPAPGPTPTPAPTTSSPTPTPELSPTPTPTPGSGGGCDPNYAGYCVPAVAYDLDCDDIGHRVMVIGVDIHGFDSDGDGIGCESYA